MVCGACEHKDLLSPQLSRHRLLDDYYYLFFILPSSFTTKRKPRDGADRRKDEGASGD